MAPKRKADVVEIDIRGQLAQLLHKDVALIRNIRRTYDETPKIAVIDVIGEILGRSADRASGYWRNLIVAYPDLEAKCSHYKFIGQGQRVTPVADLPVVSEIMLMLQGKRAKNVRRGVAPLFVECQNQANVDLSVAQIEIVD